MNFLLGVLFPFTKEMEGTVPRKKAKNIMKGFFANKHLCFALIVKKTPVFSLFANSLLYIFILILQKEHL